MRRAGALLALVAMAALPLGGLLGAAAAAASAPDADCADEALSCCGPDCALCFCCSGPIPVLEGAMGVTAPVPSSGFGGSLSADDSSPHPRPILHVPRVRSPL